MHRISRGSIPPSISMHAFTGTKRSFKKQTPNGDHIQNHKRNSMWSHPELLGNICLTQNLAAIEEPHHVATLYEYHIWFVSFWVWAGRSIRDCRAERPAMPYPKDIACNMELAYLVCEFLVWAGRSIRVAGQSTLQCHSKKILRRIWS